jgi:hypothetical protein
LIVMENNFKFKVLSVSTIFTTLEKSELTPTIESF